MYYSIQTCRAIAAFMVVLFHLGVTLTKEKYFGLSAAPIEKIFSFGGVAGVSFFFVLSGFIIMHIHYKDFNQPSRLINYIRKRAIRIYPSYLIIFIAVYSVALLLPSLRNTMPNDIFVLLKSLLLLPQNPDLVGGTGAPVIVVAWSLQYEIFFYSLIAIAIINSGFFFIGLLLLLTNFIIQSFNNQHIFILNFISNPLITLFGMGMLISYLSHKAINLTKPIPIVIIAIIAFSCACIFDIYDQDEFSGINMYLIYGILSAILILALVQIEDKKLINFKINSLVTLGDSSYVLYLIHFPLISVLSKAAMFIGLSGLNSAILSFLVIAFLCVVAGLVFHLLIEKPLLAKLTLNLQGKITF